MGRYNPNYPTVLGNEFAPVTTDPRTIDSGTAFGYTFRTITKEDLATARVNMTGPPPGQPLRKVMAVEVYPDFKAPDTGPLRKITVPCSIASSALGATVVGGGTMAQALNNPTDARWVALTGPSAAVRMHFDTGASNARLTAALVNSRIVDVTLRYAMTGAFDDHAVPAVLSIERPSAAVTFDLDNTLTGEFSQFENVVPRRSRLGDYNPFWNTTINPLTDMRRGPWMHRNGVNNFTGLEALSTAVGTYNSLKITVATTVVPAVTAFNLHYAALEITYCAENRTAAGGLDLSTGVSLDDDLFHADVPLFSTYQWGQLWDSGVGDDYLVTVGQGYVGAISATYPVPVTVDQLVSARDTFRGHRGVTINKTIREGEEWTREETDSVPAIALYNSTTVFEASTIYQPSQVYIAPIAARVDQTAGVGTNYQLISDELVAGRVYTHVRFYARKSDETTDYLRIYHTNNLNEPVGPEARITVEEFEALPEIADGWKEVTLELDPPYTTLAVGVRRWQFSGATSPTAPWEVLGADANPYRDAFLQTAGGYHQATFGTGSAYAVVENVLDIYGDLSVMLIQELETPGTLAVVPAVQDLTALDEYCGVPVEAIPTGIRYHELSWTPVNDLAVAGFAHYEVQRRDTTMPAEQWETIGTLTAVTASAMDDYEARVGRESSYRVRQVHEDGYTSPWSNTATAVLAAPGVTGTGVDQGLLILTSNQNPAGNLAYVSTYEGAGGVNNEDYSYPEGAQTTYQSMYGRDYRVAFRPLERAGVEFTRQVLINAAGVPTLTADKTALALRDLAWDTVPYVCTRDERANRWLTAISVPSSATRDVPSRGHLVLAPLSFVEVTATPAPVDQVQTCEGLRLEGPDTFQYWTAEVPAAMGGTRVQTDTFTRVTASGWGSMTSGQAWTAVGTAADFSVNGTRGRIAVPATGTFPHVVATGSVEYARSRVDIVVPAVAVGASYASGIVFRYQDATNFWRAEVACLLNGNYSLNVIRRVGGVDTSVSFGAALGTYTIGTTFHLEVMTQGTNISARVWKDAETAPAWDAGGASSIFLPAQTTLAVTGRVGTITTRGVSNTNAALVIDYDNWSVDVLPKEYDIRVLVRPFADQFTAQYGTDDFTNTNDSQGSWSLYLSYGTVGMYLFGDSFVQPETTKVAELGLVRNHLTWVRVVVNSDIGTGAVRLQFYTLATDGVTWTLVDTVTTATPSQPMPVAMPGALFSILNNAPGGIWTHKFELRIDGVLVADTDFTTQFEGAESFVDATGLDWSTDSGRGLCDTLE